MPRVPSGSSLSQLDRRTPAGLPSSPEAPWAPPAPELTRLERFGIRWLSTESKSDDATLHVLTLEEQRNLRRIQRQAVIRSALAGALSALASGSATVFAASAMPTSAGYWTVVIAATGIASVLEIAFLYVDALRATRDMAAHAGLAIRPEAEQTELALSLCRAALELPSPPHNSLGVDPHGEVSKWSLLLISLLYKAKVALTAFVLKALLRRALGRAAVRSTLEFVAVPVTAVWNAVVTHWVLKEARLRIIGPSAALELLDWTHAVPELRPLLTQAIACVIVKARSVHPNVELLARLFLQGAEPAPDLGRLSSFLPAVAALVPDQQSVVLRTLSAAAIIDGRLSARERELLERVFGSAGRSVPWTQLEELRRHMVRGDGLRADLLARLGDHLDAQPQRP